MSLKALDAVDRLRGLRATERVILLVLARWYKDETGTTFRAQSLLAEDCEMSPGNVSRILSRLSERGVLAITEAARQHRAARYRIPAVEASSLVAGTALDAASLVTGTALDTGIGIASPVLSVASPVRAARSLVAGTADLRDLDLGDLETERAAAGKSGGQCSPSRNERPIAVTSRRQYCDDCRRIVDDRDAIGHYRKHHELRIVEVAACQ